MDLSRFFRLSSPEVVGLDVGSAAVKMVQLRQNDAGYEVVAAARTYIEDDNGADRSDIKIVRAVLDCFKRSGAQSRYVVCSVCGPEVAVRDFKFPMLPPEEIDGAVQLEAEQVCPFSVADGVVDYELVPNGQNDIKGILVAATNSVIRRKSKIVRDASLQPVLMDVDGLALCNCFERCSGYEPSAAMAIVNIGYSYATLVIMGKGTRPFVRDTSNAGKVVIDKICEQTGMTKEQTDEILFSEQQEEVVEGVIEDIIESACEPLINDITGTIRYYSVQKKSPYVEKVFVCGGFAKAKGFMDLLQKRLSVEVVLWNPFENGKFRFGVNSGIEDFLRRRGCEMVVATGLAMRSI